MRRPQRLITAHRQGRRTEWRLTERGHRILGLALVIVGGGFFAASILITLARCWDDSCASHDRSRSRQLREQAVQWQSQLDQQQQQNTQVEQLQREMTETASK